MTQVTIGGGRVVCEMDEAAQAEYEKVARWLSETITARNDAYAALKVALSERDTARETHQTLVAERAAARSEVATYRKTLDEVAEIGTAAVDRAATAEAERNAARAEVAALHDDNIRTAGILGAVMRERDELRAIAQAALDNGGDRELVYAPLYQQALEDIASEEQDDNSIHVAP